MDEPKKRRGRPKKTDAEKAEADKKKAAASKAKEKKEKAEAVDAEIVSEPKKGGVGVNGNLVPLNQRTKSAQRAVQSLGGKVSAENRRKKKELREFTKAFLMQDAAAGLKQNMSMLGVNEEDMTNLAAMVARLFSKAVNQGDLNAARTIIEWAGMAPLQQERENEAIARMSQVISLAASNSEEVVNDDMDVVFYIPENGRNAVKEEDLVEVK